MAYSVLAPFSFNLTLMGFPQSHTRKVKQRSQGSPGRNKKIKSETKNSGKKQQSEKFREGSLR